MAALNFPIDLAPDDNGTFLATCPVLPEVTTFGATREEALENAVGAVEEAIAARVAEWGDVPVPGRNDLVDAFKENRAIRLSTLATIKTLLFVACKDLGVTRAELVRRMGVHREQVDRLFRFDHASKLDQLDEAFKAVGRHIELKLTA